MKPASYDGWDSNPVSQNHTDLSRKQDRFKVEETVGMLRFLGVWPRGFESHLCHTQRESIRFIQVIPRARPAVAQEDGSPRLTRLHAAWLEQSRLVHACMIWMSCCAVQCSAVQCSAVQLSAVQCRAAQLRAE